MICPNCGIVGGHTNCTSWVRQIAALRAEQDALTASMAGLREALLHAENALALSLLDCEDRGPSGNRCGECLACLRDATLVVVRATLAADPGQVAERVRLLEAERRMAYLRADAAWCEAVIAVGGLSTPSKAQE